MGDYSYDSTTNLEDDSSAQNSDEETLSNNDSDDSPAWEDSDFASEDESEDEEDYIDRNEKDPNAVAIDWSELEGALENNSPALHSFLNKKTGDVIRVFNNSDSSDRKLQDIEADPAYVYIEPISSREQYRWMEEFIEEIEDCDVKDKLISAVDGKGAFRRFKDALMDDAEKRELWFDMRSKKLRVHISGWLETKNIIAVKRTQNEEDPPRQQYETVKRNRYGASSSSNFGKSYRRKAHELVDLVPSKELPMAVAYLEFLNSRFNE